MSARRAAIGSVISRTFTNGETIYRRGEAAAAAFEVREGRIRLSWPREGGPEMSTVLGTGQIFGTAELISGEVRSATAEALGEAVVSELGRDELARLFAADAGFAGTLFRPVFHRLHREEFERLRRDENVARAREKIALPSSPELVMPSELRLKPAAREVSQQMDAGGVRIASLPFQVGRRSSRTAPADDSRAAISLSLYDTRPYSLSRSHFAIETHDGAYIVRDCGSRYGTIVNGASIGGTLPMSVAPLLRGENRIVAGRPTSPFRFTLTIDGA